jgi:hypothetical protein
MEMNERLSLFTTTYERDFDLLDRLLSSIEEYLGTEYLHYIVLNDDTKHLPELEKILQKYPMQFEVILRDQFADFSLPLLDNCYYGYRHIGPADGWSSQIMITVLVSSLIKTPYYLHLCSKDIIIEPLDIDKLILNNKIMAFKENFDHGVNTDQFIEFAVNACRFFNLTFEECRQSFIKPATPAVVNTQYMKNVLAYIAERNTSVVDLIGLNQPWKPCQGKTIEYYLYSAWLILNNLIDDTIVWYEATDEFPLNVSRSYHLRRTN